ncbi:Uncharacterised protein [Serratia entomophila]|nr:Uncharacterised protein [Serratia entomophila]
MGGFILRLLRLQIVYRGALILLQFLDDVVDLGDLAFDGLAGIGADGAGIGDAADVDLIQALAFFDLIADADKTLGNKALLRGENIDRTRQGGDLPGDINAAGIVAESQENKQGDNKGQ